MTITPANRFAGGREDRERFAPADWSGVWKLARALGRVWRLYPVLFVALLALSLAICAIVPPTYTAVAVIGPPGPSPINSMMASLSGGATSGIARRLFGGGNLGGGNDPYQEYLQLLPSTRLSQVLVERNHLLQRVFYRKWDFEHQRWKRSWLSQLVLDPVRSLLHRPVPSEPNVDTLNRFLEDHLSVVKRSSGPLSAVMPDSYVTVSFDYEDAGAAEDILNTVLLETDNIIRADQRRNVLARISFLRQQLSQASIPADERTALISILADQEQLQAMIQADDRYASTLVALPYASPIPTFPPSPLVLTVFVAFASAGVWIALAAFARRNETVARLLRRFEHGRVADPHSPASPA